MEPPDEDKGIIANGLPRPNRNWGIFFRCSKLLRTSTFLQALYQVLAGPRKGYIPHSCGVDSGAKAPRIRAQDAWSTGPTHFLSNGYSCFPMERRHLTIGSTHLTCFRREYRAL